MSDVPPRGPRAIPVPPKPSGTSVEEPAARLPRSVSDLSNVSIEPDDALEREALETLDAAPAQRRRERRGFPFGRVLFGALGAIASLAFGLAIDALLRDLFARAEWLGWLGTGLAVLLLVALVGVVGREVAALMRLKAVEAERREVVRVYETNADPRPALAGLETIVSKLPDTAAGRARLASLKDDVIDGRDMLGLAERELLRPLDAKARALVMASAKRVSVVTAVSPRAAFDLIFVLFETVRLIRRMSELYGARPGTVGLVRLVRDVLAHLAVTGSIAIGDGLIQQVVGHGLATRLSAKLGEGVVNGLLTARIGLAAMDLCRPMPFLTVRRPSVGDFLGDLVRTASPDTPSK